MFDSEADALEVRGPAADSRWTHDDFRCSSEPALILRVLRESAGTSSRSWIVRWRDRRGAMHDLTLGPVLPGTFERARSVAHDIAEHADSKDPLQHHDWRLRSSVLGYLKRTDPALRHGRLPDSLASLVRGLGNQSGRAAHLLGPEDVLAMRESMKEAQGRNEAEALTALLFFVYDDLEERGRVARNPVRELLESEERIDFRALDEVIGPDRARALRSRSAPAAERSGSQPGVPGQPAADTDQ